MDTQEEKSDEIIIPLTEHESHMSRTVYEHTIDGKIITHPLSIISLQDGKIIITPFTSEPPSTIYHDHPLHLYPHTRTIHIGRNSVK